MPVAITSTTTTKVSIMQSEKTKSFIERAVSIHGDKYDYSNVVYTASKNNVKINCKVHGAFEQRASRHLNGSGCRKCAIDKITMNTASFLEKSKKIHGDRYDYSLSSCNNARDLVSIICKKHGVFEQMATLHATGYGCQKCANESSRLDTADVLRRFREVHGNKYSYGDFQYRTGMEKIKITCPDHGEFEQYARYHLRGMGCKKCHSGGYDRKSFITLCKKKSGVAELYLIKCFDDNECFYKVGITSTSTEERFNNIVLMPYKFEIIARIKGKPVDIWNAEKKLNSICSKDHYVPKIKFNGSSRECFSRLAEPVLSLFGEGLSCN